MPPKSTRLTRPRFLGTFKRGRRVRTPLFELITASSANLGYAVVVSKKVASSAVLRNRVRRRVYHILRDIFRGRSVRGEYIFIMKAAGRDTPTPILRGEIEKTLSGFLTSKKQ